jgi:hypothetical protein
MIIIQLLTIYYIVNSWATADTAKELRGLL